MYTCVHMCVRVCMYACVCVCCVCRDLRRPEEGVMNAGAMRDTGDSEPHMDTEKQSTVFSKTPNSTALFQIQFLFFLS